MIHATEYNDLCVTCNYMALCTRRKNIRRPILFCEEFDTTSNPRTVKFNNPSNHPGIKNNPGQSTSQFKGICSNCENRETCMFPKPEEGIWHCEEYV